MTSTVISLSLARRDRGLPPVDPDIDAIVSRARPSWLIGRHLLHQPSRWRGICRELRVRAGRWEAFVQGATGVGFWLLATDLLPDGDAA